MTQALNETERWPLLTEQGRQTLHRLYQHPHAPNFNHRCGDRLTSGGLQRTRQYEKALKANRIDWKTGEVPKWAQRFAKRCLDKVPIYRRNGGSSRNFFSLPTISRTDLAREPWSFVPDGQPLDDLIVYNTSGRTGHPLAILCHPEVSSQYLPLLRKVLGAHKVTLRGGPRRVAIVLVCAQRRTYTYASVSSFLDGAGFAKINLNSADWKHPADRVAFLDDCRADVYTGDPISFLELARLPLQSRPKALVSTAMAMLPRFRRQLEKRFRCPVIDLYSLNECGPVAFANANGHRLFAHDIFVEVLRADGTSCAPGERGEIVVTTARNPFLPLLRYRTGDWASLAFERGVPLLKNLEGRPPVLFRDAEGRVINNIDISNALRSLPMAQFHLHQAANGNLTFRVLASIGVKKEATRLLRQLFGTRATLFVRKLTQKESRAGKLLQYTSELT